MNIYKLIELSNIVVCADGLVIKDASMKTPYTTYNDIGDFKSDNEIVLYHDCDEYSVHNVYPRSHIEIYISTSAYAIYKHHIDELIEYGCEPIVHQYYTQSY